MRIVKIFSFIAIFALAMASSIFSPGNAFAATNASGTDPNAGVAAAVQSYFADIPIMAAIATCESGPRQFEADGSPLIGGTGTMVGIFQIDEVGHRAAALALGFDIDTVAGNMGYARYLYGAQGTEPWISSFGCWGAATAGASATTTAPTLTPTLTSNLSLGAIDPQVLLLQQMLNAAGFILATSGPGSPGNETTKFGALTYAALKNFQCSKGIACSGEEATTGYGFLNATTRAALIAAQPGNASTTTTVIATSTATITPATTTVAVAPSDNSAEVAELQSRIAALVAVVAQLEAEIAAR